MTRAIVCDDCGTVVQEPDAELATSASRHDGREWSEVDLCGDCVPAELTQLLDEHAELLVEP